MLELTKVQSSGQHIQKRMPNVHVKHQMFSFSMSGETKAMN